MTSRRLLATAIALVLVLAAACQDQTPPPTAPRTATPTAPQAEPPGAQERVRVLVALPEVAAQGRVATAARGLGATVVREYRNFPLLALEVDANALDGLRRVPGVRSIVEDEAVPPTVLQSIPLINADDVHDLGLDGSGVAVAIIDTGIDADHTFLGGRVVAEACFATDDPSENRTSLCPGEVESLTGQGSASIDVPACQNGGDNLCDHGTHVAGIAAGNGSGLSFEPMGVARSADILAVQVFHRVDDPGRCFPSPSPCVRTFDSDYIAALDWVYDQRNSHVIAAVNMSLGGSPSSAYCDTEPAKAAIDLLLSVGIATVVSAGNNGSDDGASTPGCVSSAVTVGATDDDDVVADFSNRGLLDLFAPGVGIVSSVQDGFFEVKNGTSMAAPHVAGALAVLRQADPGASIGDLVNRLKNNGVPIGYWSGGQLRFTPRIDLLAALQFGASPPALTVTDAVVTVDEGMAASNTGTVSGGVSPVELSASVGSVTDQGGGAWSWSFPTSDGPADAQTVTITATDLLGGEDEVTFQLIVVNVPPQVTIDPAQPTTVAEGQTLPITAHIEDPGTADTHTALVTCHSVDGGSTVAGSVTGGVVTANCPYGDDSDPTFQVDVSVTDDDGGQSPAASFQVTTTNVDPTVAIDGTVPVDGLATLIVQIGDPVTVQGTVSDPGSDDLTLAWDWGDGSSDLVTYPANGPGSDPLPSPTVGPRSITDVQTHGWNDACTFQLTLTGTDDDGGSGSDQATVLVAGASGMARSQGYWAVRYRGRAPGFEAATLDCYLATVQHLSTVFSEVRDASTRSRAASVLWVNGNGGDMLELLDQQLLAAWLNFADGAFGYDDPVDTTGDGVPDTPFSAAVAGAESVRLDPGATRAQLEQQKDVLEAINLMHGG